MATTCHLLGPPSLNHPSGGHGGSTTTISATAGISQENNLLMGPTDHKSPEDLVTMMSTQAKFLNLNLSEDQPIMGLTENFSPTFLSTGNPCLDFFFHVVPETPPEVLIGRLELAWSHNPLLTLKLICNLRGVRGTGKSDKEGFYTAAFWLHHRHPKTLAGNVKAVAEFGYFKDFLEILYRILEGPLIRKIQKSERSSKRGRAIVKEFEETESSEGEIMEEVKDIGSPEKETKKKKEKKVKSLKEIKEEKEKARVLRKEKEMNKAKKALEKYNLDENYRLLHDSISGFFAELLRADIDNLNAGNLSKITLAAKWCPTVDSFYDKATLMCEGIARKMFPREKYSEYEGIEEGHYVYRVRDRLRKEVLVPLHKALELPEVYMSANQWNSLPYSRVASVAMKIYKKHFEKHDRERFQQYLENVKSGKAKIAAGALLPHEIIGTLNDEDGGAVAELQWKKMVDDMAKGGKLSNCIAVSDVSASMNGTPMEVSVALGILVSELSEEPWKGKLITFSETPELQTVEGENLLAKTKFVKKMDWGGSTNFQGVFDRILEVAVEGKLIEEHLIKRVFVFSDMEFNQASQNPWETDYQAIQRKFREKGYQNVPEIVFWNLRDSRSTPVVGKQSGVALLSGFSKNLLTMFLKGAGVVNPEQVMELAISGEEYNKLAIFD